MFVVIDEPLFVQIVWEKMEPAPRVLAKKKAIFVSKRSTVTCYRR